MRFCGLYNGPLGGLRLPSAQNRNYPSYKNLLGFTFYLVLAEFQTKEDSMGRRQRLAFQMTEQDLNDLEAAVRRAQDQLDILKSKTNALTNEDK